MLCPFCDFQGSIYKAKIRGIEKVVYICDECEALWTEKEAKFIGKVDLDSLNHFLQSYNLRLETGLILDLGYNWDKSILDNPRIVFCPLCGPHGIIYKTLVKKLGIYVYFCDACDAMWHEGQEIRADNHENLLQFLKSKGFKYYAEACLSDFTLDWSK